MGVFDQRAVGVPDFVFGCAGFESQLLEGGGDRVVGGRRRWSARWLFDLEREPSAEVGDRHLVFAEHDVGVGRFEAEKHPRIERDHDIPLGQIKRDLQAVEFVLLDERLADGVQIRPNLDVSAERPVDAVVVVLGGLREQSVAEVEDSGDRH